MRKWLLAFLMLILPLQWTAALAADCCLRHDGQEPGQAQHAGMTSAHTMHVMHAEHARPAGHADHVDHAAHAKNQMPGEQAKLDASPDANSAGNAPSDCSMDCVGCHLHHCAAAVFELVAFAALNPLGGDDTPYLSRLPVPRPDTLLRPPLARLA